MSEFRRIRMPMSREDARSLRAGDMILLDGEIIITAGLPTVQRLVACAEEGRDPPYRAGWRVAAASRFLLAGHRRWRA